jgi:hypothetical protein
MPEQEFSRDSFCRATASAYFNEASASFYSASSEAQVRARARVWRQFRDLACEVDRDPFRSDAQNNALGFRIARDDTAFAFLDRYNFGCY